MSPIQLREIAYRNAAGLINAMDLDAFFGEEFYRQHGGTVNKDKALEAAQKAVVGALERQAQRLKEAA